MPPNHELPPDITYAEAPKAQLGSEEHGNNLFFGGLGALGIAGIIGVLAWRSKVDIGTAPTLPSDAQRVSTTATLVEHEAVLAKVLGTIGAGMTLYGWRIKSRLSRHPASSEPVDIDPDEASATAA